MQMLVGVVINEIEPAKKPKRIYKRKYRKVWERIPEFKG